MKIDKNEMAFLIYSSIVEDLINFFPEDKYEKLLKTKKELLRSLEVVSRNLEEIPNLSIFVDFNSYKEDDYFNSKFFKKYDTIYYRTDNNKLSYFNRNAKKHVKNRVMDNGLKKYFDSVMEKSIAEEGFSYTEISEKIHDEFIENFKFNTVNEKKIEDTIFYVRNLLNQNDKAIINAFDIKVSFYLFGELAYSALSKGKTEIGEEKKILVANFDLIDKGFQKSVIKKITSAIDKKKENIRAIIKMKNHYRIEIKRRLDEIQRNGKENPNQEEDDYIVNIVDSIGKPKILDKRPSLNLYRDRAKNPKIRVLIIHNENKSKDIPLSEIFDNKTEKEFLKKIKWGKSKKQNQIHRQKNLDEKFLKSIKEASKKIEDEFTASDTSAIYSSLTSYEIKNRTVHLVAPDGDCGYTAFCIERKDAAQLLIEKIEKNELIQHKISLLVKELFVKNLLVNKPCKESIKEKIEFIEFSDYLKNQHKSLDINNKDIETLAKNLGVLKAYIEFDVRDAKISNGWAHPLVLHSIAQIQNIELIIWVKAQNNLVPHRCDGHYDYHTTGLENPTERVELLFVNGNHFERLEPVVSSSKVATIHTSEEAKQNSTITENPNQSQRPEMTDANKEKNPSVASNSNVTVPKSDIQSAPSNVTVNLSGLKQGGAQSTPTQMLSSPYINLQTPHKSDSIEPSNHSLESKTDIADNSTNYQCNQTESCEEYSNSSDGNTGETTNKTTKSDGIIRHIMFFENISKQPDNASQSNLNRNSIFSNT